MKRFATKTDFVPFKYVRGNSEGDRIETVADGDGNTKIFKTRKAVENYCIKHRLMYFERKLIFYR